MSCHGTHGNAVKFGGVYRFGVFALEIWGTDWGRGTAYDFYGDDHLRVRGLGVSAAWRTHLRVRF